MQAMRDNPECAQQEFDVKFDTEDPGLNASLSFDINEDIVADLIVKDADNETNPRVAILREQGLTLTLKWQQHLIALVSLQLTFICLTS